MEWKDIFVNVPVNPVEEQAIKTEYECFNQLIYDLSYMSNDDGKTTEEQKNKQEQFKIDQNKFLGQKNAIATIRNRSFWKEEQNKIKEANHWKAITELLQCMVKLYNEKNKDVQLLQKHEELEKYIDENINTALNSKPSAATLRLAASVLPDYLSSIASPSDIQELLKFLKNNKLITKDEYREINKKTSFDKSHFLLQTIRGEFFNYTNKQETPCYSLPWKILEFFRGKDFVNIESFLRCNQNIILTGAPGTGKTYLAKKVASYMITGNSDFERFDKEVDTDLADEEQEKFKSDKENFKKRCKFVQFHPSYDYTDFVEGLRPKQDDNSKQIVFERRNGIFKEFCKEAVAEMANAKNDKRDAAPYVFIIDEINRGEISRIFGELFFSIDPGYRGEKGKVDTQYQNLISQGNDFAGGFYVPENVYVIGTMNDIDRSVESMDFAFRRRFAFYEVEANADMLDYIENVDSDVIKKLKIRMNNLNDEIVKDQYGLSSAYQIGAAYFKKFENYYTNKKDEKYSFDALWDNHLKGLLNEYFRGLPKSEINKYLDELKKAYNDEKSKGESTIADLQNNPQP